MSMRLELAVSVVAKQYATANLRRSRVNIVWNGLNSQSLPAGMVPLDASADAMKAASRWAGTPNATAILGCDSVDG
jgi:hypothetical protein